MINAIVKTINSGVHDDELKYSSLFTGKSGMCLFDAYLLMYSGLDMYEERLYKNVQESLDFVSADQDLVYSFSIGLTGVAWTIQHLISNNLIQCNLEELFADVLTDIKKYSEIELQYNRYDYFESGLGYLLLLLEKNELQDGDIAFLHNAIEIMLTTACYPADDIMAWRADIPGIIEGGESYDIGLAHGMPGIIIILSLLYKKHPAFRTQLEPIIEKCVNWILTIKVTGGRSFFTCFLINNMPTAQTALRWCYGDMGVAMCLVLSGRLLKKKGWEEEAVRIMKNCSRRLDDELQNIESAHLCHGTAGVAHIFNRFYQYTGIEDFKVSAILCFDATLKKAEYNSEQDVIFLVENGVEEKMLPKKPSAGMLEGSAGIALALLAAISDIEPRWDRCFLLS